MLFDAGLIAIGNVRNVWYYGEFSIHWSWIDTADSLTAIDPVLIGNHSHHWTTFNAAVFHAARKNSRDHMLPWGNTVDFLPMAYYWVCCRDFRVPQSLWVRSCQFSIWKKKVSLNFLGVLMPRSPLSDFFPVIFGFLKRLPIIGTILCHPAVSRVSLNIMRLVLTNWLMLFWLSALVFAERVANTRLRDIYAGNTLVSNFLTHCKISIWMLRIR